MGVHDTYVRLTQGFDDDCTFPSPQISHYSSDLDGTEYASNSFVPVWALQSPSLESTHSSAHIKARRLKEVATDFTRSADLSQFLKGSIHPKRPCDYCRRNRLECIVLYTDPNANPNPVEACSSCVGLNRECSRSKGQRREAASFEDSEPGYGPLRSVREQVEDPEDRIDGRLSSGIVSLPRPTERISRSEKRARVDLKAWYQEHRDNPYPTQEEQAQFARDTGLSLRQVNNFFINRRRRDKCLKRMGYKKNHLRPASPMPGTPMDRWRHSPPEEEPAKVEDIIMAMKRGVEILSSPPQYSYPSDSDCLSNCGPESAFSSVSSMGEYCSEYCVSENSFQVSSIESNSHLQEAPTQSRAERSRTSNRYQCTFCEKRFGRKFDWCRHERTIHITLELWTCPAKDSLIERMGLGPRLDLPHPFGDPPECQVCNALVPDHNHWEIHEFDTCAREHHLGKAFTRKDHLQQHLQRYHRCSKPLSKSHLERCRLVRDDVKSRCGFCGDTLLTWSERSEHLAKHFQADCTMNQWQGDWGLDDKWIKRLKKVKRRLDRRVSISRSDLANEVDGGVFHFQL